MAVRRSRPKARRVKRVPRIPRATHAAVTRDELNRLIALLNERGELLQSVLHNQDIQFKRLAQLQAELDLIKTRS
jgi:hypothetical protein